MFSVAVRKKGGGGNSAAPCLPAGVVWITALRFRWKNRGKSSHMPTPKLTAEILTAAILGIEVQKQKLDAKIAELRAMLPGGPAESAAPEPTKAKNFSAATRRKMAAAQKARWAKLRGESEPPAPATPKRPKPKRRISKEGLARIVAATKKRWAAVRAAKAQQEKAAKKTATRKTAA